MPEYLDEDGNIRPDKKPELVLRSKCLTSFDIAQAIYEAFDLYKKAQAPAVSFAYPSALTEYEWICHLAHHAGYVKADNEHQDKKKKD